MMIEVESNIIKPEEGVEGEKAKDPGLTRLFNFLANISDHIIVSHLVCLTFEGWCVSLRQKVI